MSILYVPKLFLTNQNFANILETSIKVLLYQKIANGKKMKTYFFDLSDLGMFTKLLAQVSIRFFLKRHSGKEYVY